MIILVTAMFLLVLVARGPLPLCVRRIQHVLSESVPGCLFYPAGHLCADHRDWHSTFLRSLRPPGNNPAVAE
jgi:hypothetical protein